MVIVHSDSSYIVEQGMAVTPSFCRGTREFRLQLLTRTQIKDRQKTDLPRTGKGHERGH